MKSGRNIACRTCDAAPGHACTTVVGVKMDTVHKARKRTTRRRVAPSARLDGLLDGLGLMNHQRGHQPTLFDESQNND